MGLFKSNEERRIEREIEVRKGLHTIKRNIRDLERNEQQYLEKARRALQMGSQEQLRFLKQTLKRTAIQRRSMERQLLNIETAMQIKNQTEAHAQFAKAMRAVSTSIGEMFGATDLTATQVDFEKAMVKAQTLEEQMDLFLDMSSSAMSGELSASGDDLVTDDEIDRMIEDEVVAEESISELDQAIANGLDDVRKELGKEDR
ncbi:MAG: hypothetical protein AAF581_16160 [Planctomycetota bacterium]